MSLFPTARNAGSGRASAGYAFVEKVGVGRDEWNRLLEAAPGGGHVLQSHEWGELKRAQGWRPLRFALERDGGEVAGAGQFLLRQTWPVPGYLMYSPKGPWLDWEDEEAVRAFFRGAAAAAARNGAHTLKIETEVREGQEREKALIRELGFEKFRWDLHGKATMLMDLSRSEEDLLAGMKSKMRYNVRLSARKGVRVVEDTSPEGEEDYWRLFQETAKRQGVVQRRTRDYFFYVWRKMREAGRANLFFAEHEGDRLAAMYVFTFGEKYWYMYGASTDVIKRNLMAPSLLQWEVMRWAKGRGITYYDMMGIPELDKLNDENHPWYNVYKFKLGFGGEAVEFAGCYDLPIKRVRAELWNKVEPIYYRLYHKLKGNIYY